MDFTKLHEIIKLRFTARALIAVLLAFYSCFSFAEDLDLGDGEVLTQAQVDEISRALPSLEEDKVFYHWADGTRAWRWVKQGYVDHGEMDFLNKPSGSLQAYGPGLYLAGTPTSSKSFGTTPVIFEMKKGTPLYDAEVVEKVIHHGLSANQIAKLGERINFVRRVAGDWYTTNSAANTGRVSYGGRLDATDKSGKGVAHLYSTISELAQQDPHKYGYLNSLSHLLNYQDGTTFVRSVHQKPHDPWSEFDPHNFEKFKNTSEQVFSEVAQGKNFGIAKKGYFGDPESSQTPREWAQKQVALFEEMHNSILGRGRPDYRTAPVIGGGDQEDGHAIVSEAQYREMNANPYLNIVGSKKPNGYYDVKIHYPTLENAERFEPVLSHEFFKQLKDKGDLTKLSPAEHASLTQGLLHDLLEERFFRAHGKPFDDSLFRDMIAIHPFDDGNGRTIRLLQRIGASDAGVKIPYFAISDLDVMTPSKIHNNLLIESNKAYEKWLGDLLAETQAASREHRLPQLIQYDHAARVGESLAGIGANPVWDHEALHNIGLREWAPLLDKWVGHQWQELQSADLREILHHPSKFMSEKTTAQDIQRFVKKKLLSDPTAMMMTFAEDLDGIDKIFDPTLVRLGIDHPEDMSDRARETLWQRLKRNGSLANLDENERLKFARQSLGAPNSRAAMGDAELIKALKSVNPHTATTHEFDQLFHYVRSGVTKEMDPAIKAALNQILDVDLKTLSDNQARSLSAVFSEMNAKRLNGPESVRYVQRNFAVIDENTKYNLYQFLKQNKDDSFRDLKKAVVTEGLKRFSKASSTFESHTAFFDLLESHPLDKREFANLVQGFRSQRSLGPDAINALEQFQPSADETKILEKEVRRFVAAKRRPNQMFYTLVRKLENTHPELGVADYAAHAEVAAGRGPEFVSATELWPKAINEDFKLHPSYYDAVSDRAMKIFAAQKAPAPDVDEVLTKFAQLGDADTTELVVGYAKVLKPELTPGLDQEIAKNVSHHLPTKGFAEYGRTRPVIAQEVIKNVDSIASGRALANAAMIVGDHPELMAKAVTTIGKDIGTGSALSHAYYRDFAIHHPDALSLEQNAYLIGNYGSAADGVKFALKDPTHIAEFLKVFEKGDVYLATEPNRQTLRELLALKDPPKFLEDALLKSFVGSDWLQRAAFRQFKELAKLEPWSRDLFTKMVSHAEPDVQKFIESDLAADAMESSIRKQLGKAFLESNAPNKEKVLTRLGYQTKREAMGFPTKQSANLDSNAFEEKMSQSLLKERWTREEIELMAQESADLESLVMRTVYAAPLSQAMKRKITDSRNVARAGADLLATMSNRGGKISSAQVNNWIATDTCSRPKPKFISTALKMMGLNQ